MATHWIGIPSIVWATSFSSISRTLSFTPREPRTVSWYRIPRTICSPLRDLRFLSKDIALRRRGICCSSGTAISCPWHTVASNNPAMRCADRRRTCRKRRGSGTSLGSGVAPPVLHRGFCITAYSPDGSLQHAQDDSWFFLQPVREKTSVETPQRSLSGRSFPAHRSFRAFEATTPGRLSQVRCQSECTDGGEIVAGGVGIAGTRSGDPRRHGRNYNLHG